MAKYFETFGTGVTLTGASGLAYLAVDHPPAFRLLALIIVIVSTAIVAGAYLWNESSKFTYSATAPFMSDGKSPEALRAAQSRRVPFVPLIFGYAGLLLLVVLFYFLPELLALPQ